MSELSVWFERKFKFDFPVELYPNLRVRLRGAPPRLEELTRELPREQLTRKPDGKWSVQENAGHLLDLEPLWLARVEDFLAGAETLSAADLTNRKTHQARHNQRPLADLLADFRRARGALLERLDSLRPQDFSRTALHPRLQTPMRVVDHLYFIAEHDDHHLARIWELRQAG
ncbi:MAG: DinB family protein [Terriglobia bacterium]